VPDNKKEYGILIDKSYAEFEGKIIRHIQILSLDPFGNSLSDTLAHPTNFIGKAGNRLHVKSREITIKNLMLIHKNQVFDSYLVKESERLLRARPFIQDVMFSVKTVSANSDSVDIDVLELDKWSILPDFSASTSNFTIHLDDRNFLGLGHEFKNVYSWYWKDKLPVYNFTYFIPNIKNTYINWKFSKKN